jgi:signal transduction histidine kinase
LFIDTSFFITYHCWEEFLIALVCVSIAGRLFQLPADHGTRLDPEEKSRIYLVRTGYILLALSSAVHAFIHVRDLNFNLLYLTLLGYCFALLTFIVAISSARPQTKRFFPFLYLLLLLLLIPDVYENLPAFRKFRPVVWISVAFLAGHVCVLHVAAFYRVKNKRVLFSAAGFLFVCVSAIFLFFPAPIGSPMWIYGHFFRPVGFVILWLTINRRMVADMGGSILYRVLTAFSLLTAIPMLIFGTAVFYVNIDPIDMAGRRVLIFLVMLATFTSVLIFGFGLIIKLIQPILDLKESVDRLVDEGLDKRIEVTSNDEIGELSNAFNEMVVKLSGAVKEQERLYRLAATGELAATLAHEIKNPLNAIGGAAVYIERNYDGILIKEFIKIITDEVSRINKLTGTLLGFAKPIYPEIALHDMNKLIRETTLLLEKEAQEQQIVLQEKLPDKMVNILFDYNQIKQVLINLIINAFDAIEGQGEIIITSKFSSGKVDVMVSDNGPGISPENMENIFNPFFTTKTRGTGIGLSISQKIARGHNGDLRVESTPGKGTVFTLTLPQGDS